MKARLSVTLNTVSVEEAQRLLSTFGEGLVASGSLSDYQFEIETDQGIVTEKCILSGDRVIA
jgi:hypothetical protein